MNYVMWNFYHDAELIVEEWATRASNYSKSHINTVKNICLDHKIVPSFSHSDINSWTHRLAAFEMGFEFVKGNRDDYIKYVSMLILGRTISKPIKIEANRLGGSQSKIRTAKEDRAKRLARILYDNDIPFSLLRGNAVEITSDGEFIDLDAVIQMARRKREKAGIRSGTNQKPTKPRKKKLKIAE